MNFGVASKLGERTSDELRSLLLRFVSDYYQDQMPEPERVSFFGAKIPTLDAATWKGLKAAGDRWALIGDAAGFCDPITGEGIYYAFKSADLLADALVQGAAPRPAKSHGARIAVAGDDSASNGGSPKANPEWKGDDSYTRATALYEQRWRESFGRELENASARLPRFYRGFFFGQVFTDAMIRFARYHRGVRTVLGKAITGDQSYITLKRDLLKSALRVF
jgi:flavin-dependent dehydrogenase